MTKRSVRSINRDRQLSLLEPIPNGATHQQSVTTKRVFIQPDPSDIYLGHVSLQDHLKQAGLKAPLVVRDLLLEQDWRDFEHQYQSCGRAPYAPVAMMGIILYGIHNGIHSLRALERFARADLGCMWVSGGICPDHSVLGDFICRHAELISNSLFASLTTSVLKRSGGNNAQLAGDGTVIEAACSHYGLLKQEAVDAHCKAAQAASDKAPDDASKQARLVKAEQTAALMHERVEKKRVQGKNTEHLRISTIEPEAMVQRQKRGRGSAPAYKPSVLANAQRVVVAHAVDVSSETVVIPAMLDQSERVGGQPVEELLLDAGYCCDAVIAETLERDISLLCPEGKNPGENKTSDKYYTKACFHYDEGIDGYRCPAGELLMPLSHYKGNDNTPGYVQYGTRACMDCAQKTRCTRSKQGRRIKRYAGDERKEALRDVMSQSGVKVVFSKRQAWVEPVFSVLRDVQGLNRFRRKGLSRVKTEFGLHILAYNLGRAIAFSFLRYWAARRVSGRSKAVFFDLAILYRSLILIFAIDAIIDRPALNES